MLRGRRKLPVLAEISGPAPDGSRVFSLRREDLARLADLQEGLGERRALLVTGGEGVARTVAVAFAGAACASGRRVALVDCDLAAPRLAAELGLAEEPGVHEYLRWEAGPAQILQPVSLAGPASGGASGPLIVIAGGRPAADPGTLVGLQSFHHMTTKLRHGYDLVVLAGPAIEAANAPLPTLADEAEVVLAGLTPEQASGRSGRGVLAALRSLAPETLGAVVVGEG
jgi:Mrp family chromosome partitioning ATPase